MVFDRRFTAASPRYLGFSGSTANRQRWAMPVTEHLCPLDPALLNGVRPHQVLASASSPADWDSKYTRPDADPEICDRYVYPLLMS